MTPRADEVLHALDFTARCHYKPVHDATVTVRTNCCGAVVFLCLAHLWAAEGACESWGGGKCRTCGRVFASWGEGVEVRTL